MNNLKKYNMAVFYPTRRDNLHEKEYISLPQILKAENFPPEETTKYEEFMHLMHNSSYDLLIAWYGGAIDNGYSCFDLAQCLSADDWLRLEKCKDKKIIGRSDITYLLTPLAQHGFRCFYGPNYSSLAEVEHDVNTRKTTLDYLYRAISSVKPYTIDFADSAIARKDTPWTIKAGLARGRLIGGNLDTIFQMVQKAPHFFQFNPGDILLLEDIQSLYNFNKKDGIHGLALNKLMIIKETGIFDVISGLLIGKTKIPLVYDADKELYHEPVKNEDELFYLKRILLSIIERNIPILANVSCSHTVPMITLPLYREILLDSISAKVTVYPE